MNMLPTTANERENLEAHVDLCAIRYASLDQRLTNIENKMAGFEATLTENKRSLSTVIITSAASIVGGLITLIVTILMKF